MRKIVFIITLVALVGLAYAADQPKSEVGVKPIGVGHHHAQPPQHDAIDGTAWIQYDDGTAESFYAGFGAAGNTFVQTATGWASFYCDGASIYAQYSGGIYLTGYAGLNTAGTALTGFEDDFMSNTGSGTGWVAWTTGTGSFFNNPTFTWQDTAYIAAYYSDAVGLDTNGAGSNGFSVTSFTGSGYVNESYNALLRARFNGPGVPVELMGFTVE